MIAYLASFAGGSVKAGDGRRLPALLNEKNGFLEKIRSNWKPDSRVLIISAGPEQIERNDLILDNYAAAFPMSGLTVCEMIMCDSRNASVIEDILKYDVLLLAGGHVPTQNVFFEKLRLRERLQDFNGMIIGNSAGTMNSAEIVYAQPELEGESIDEAYQRFLPGLGLTKVMILPHYQLIKDDILDGKRVFEDITYPDSFGREFYALVDGSYLVVENGVTMLYGEAYLIKGGVLSQVCRDGESRLME